MTGTDARTDLATRDDLLVLLREFYGAAYADDLIGFVFTDVTRMDLEAHLPVIADFWETVLFRTGAYRRNAFRPHVAIHERAPLTEEMFARWVDLWTAAVDRRWTGPKAELAKQQARVVAESMRRRLSGRSGSLLEPADLRTGAGD